MAPKYGRKSLAQLATIDPRLARAHQKLLDLGHDHSILEGRRSRDDQNRKHAHGRSRVRWPDSKHNCATPLEGVPRHEWPEDADGLSKAVDSAPYVADLNGPGRGGNPWPDSATERRVRADPALLEYVKRVGLFYAHAARVQLLLQLDGVEARSGLDWDRDGDVRDQNFDDGPHHEIVGD